MTDNRQGIPLTRDILESLGFIYEVVKDYDGDEIHWWIKNGISIYEDTWWIKNGKSLYSKDEKEPEITFSYATYIKSDGRFKGGFIIFTDTQLKNLVYSLTSKWI